MVLASIPSSTTLEELAKIADSVVDATTTPGVSGIHQASDSDLASQVQRLQLDVSSLRSQFTQPPPHSRRQSREQYQRPARDRTPSPRPNSQLCYYHNRFGSRARKCASPCSWSSPNTNAVTAQIKNDPATDNHFFYVTDRNSGLRFLVDTGAQVSVIPPSPADRQHRLDNLSLQAANNTPITTFGTRSLTLNLALRRTFRWIFIVGDVKTPILGADFFHGYNLLVDVRNHRLVDSLTQITVNGILTQESSPSPTMLPDKPRNEYDAILKQFPTLLQPSGAPKQPVQHTVTHHIETTGPPLRARSRRLPPQKLIAARQEFDHMLELGIIRPSSSNLRYNL